MEVEPAHAVVERGAAIVGAEAGRDIGEQIEVDGPGPYLRAGDGEGFRAQNFRAVARDHGEGVDAGRNEDAREEVAGRILRLDVLTVDSDLYTQFVGEEGITGDQDVLPGGDAFAFLGRFDHQAGSTGRRIGDAFGMIIARLQAVDVGEGGSDTITAERLTT
jgi:hypothetical protein